MWDTNKSGPSVIFKMSLQDALTSFQALINCIFINHNSWDYIASFNEVIKATPKDN